MLRTIPRCPRLGIQMHGARFPDGNLHPRNVIGSHACSFEADTCKLRPNAKGPAPLVATPT
jgi:hypothetical protein